MPEPPRLVVKIPNKRLKYDYRRSCQLLGVSMSGRIHQTIQATIRKAKEQYPQAFRLLTPDEELVLEAVEELHSTVLEIQMYTRIEKARIVEMLESLVQRGHVREICERRQNVTKGPEPRSYVAIRK